jgi:capsular polysaccharide biosynthesis protein
MDVLSILRLLVRRWRVTAPAALLTVILIGVAFLSSSPTYEATASIALLPPPEAPDPNAPSASALPPGVGQNPFARYGDLSVVADILARVMDSDSRQAEFESQGVTGYDVVVNRLQRGPVVDVTGEGPNPEAAIQSTEVVVEEVTAVLAELQQDEDADPAYLIKSAVLEPPSTATAMYGSTLRTAIAALAVGALVTLGLAVLAEAIARTREARPTVAVEPATPEAASNGTETGASNGSHKAGLSDILPTLRRLRREPAEREPGHQRPVRETATRQEWSKRERTRQATAQQTTAQQTAARLDAPGESPSDNGDTRPTTDRSQ